MIEKFLAVLTALVAAIEANTAALKAGASAAPAATKGKTKEKEAAPAGETGGTTTTATTPTAPTHTVADVRAAAQALLDANGNDGTALGELNKKYGTKRISEVPADKYSEVVKALTEMTAKAKGAADSGI